MLKLFLTIYAGLEHAFEADHLLAVSNLVTHRNDIKQSIKDGIFWGIGHTSTIFFVGILMIFFKEWNVRFWEENQTDNRSHRWANSWKHCSSISKWIGRKIGRHFKLGFLKREYRCCDIRGVEKGSRIKWQPKNRRWRFRVIGLKYFMFQRFIFFVFFLVLA